MSDHDDPFEHYVREVIHHLVKLSPEQQAQIAKELRTHLEDAAAAYGDQAKSPSVRARIVRQMGTPRNVGRALAKVHAPMNIWHYVRQITVRLRKVAAGLTATAALMFFCFSLMIVPVPNSRTATHLTGTVACISRPHPTNGDMTIVLEDGRKFYVNHADEVEYFAWERLLREVRAGETIHLTAVQPLGSAGSSRAVLEGIHHSQAFEPPASSIWMSGFQRIHGAGRDWRYRWPWQHS